MSCSLKPVIVGARVAVVGNFEHIDQKALRNVLDNLGVEIVDELTAKTDFVLAGDDSSQSALSAAKKFHIRVLSEEEILEFIGNRSPSYDTDRSKTRKNLAFKRSFSTN